MAAVALPASAAGHAPRHAHHPRTGQATAAEAALPETLGQLAQAWNIKSRYDVIKEGGRRAGIARVVKIER